ncbi:MAG: 2-amino-4-hydroxy-6-hydroxymethyldihydropteridine diphosphokinase, partial [Deltaproteobacteria bacterium]|nr:2-amino-4-hydroxy-6-hydroxymethyldihydropteridine diphosphokinase [Deltaproteobacteria bacterium]
MMKTAYIGLGSNLGDSLQILRQAWLRLGQEPAI